MASRHFQLLLLVTSWFPVMDGKPLLNHTWGQLAIKVVKASYFGKAKLGCGEEASVYDAGLCYKPCSKFTDSSWAFAKGVGPVCWGCPSSHPSEELGLCYRRCPSDKPDTGAFMCYGDCPSGYRNDGLTCFRDAHIFGADVSGCPWYDICGLTFARGCSDCPSGYHNDGCTCRRDPHLVPRPSHNRGIGLVMKTVGRGVGIPVDWRYPPMKALDCKTPGWYGKGYAKNSMEMVMYRNDLQKIVVFGFRGTDNDIADWLLTFDILPRDVWVIGKWGVRKVTTHRGFASRYNNVGHWFEKQYSEVPSNYVILITGHSQGAAQATIGALSATARTGRRPDGVILWGSPLTAAKNFRDLYKEIVGCDITRDYVNGGDFVTRIPAVFGYNHVCPVFKIGRDNASVKVSHDPWGDGGYEDEFLKAFADAGVVKKGCDLPSSEDENEDIPDESLTLSLDISQVSFYDYS